MDLESLDKKDIEILRVLNENYRYPFSVIARKVGLSKNSVRLRFDKLQYLMLHNTTGINNKIIGLNLVKIYYVIDSFGNDLENKITLELKKHKHIAYAARLYGHYNLEVALFVKDFQDLSDQINMFNSKFSKYISEKNIEVVDEEFFFRDNFLFDDSNAKPRSIINKQQIKVLSKSDKKILIILREDPRISILDISKKVQLSPKTVIKCLKLLTSSGIITGFFMMLDYSKFGLSTFKILIQTNNITDKNDFDMFLSSLKSIKHYSKMIGFWDYEADVLYSSILELQNDIEKLKVKFPRQIKKIEIINHGKRIFTNKEKFLS